MQWTFNCECGQEWESQDGPEDICPICSAAVYAEPERHKVKVRTAFEWQCPHCGEYNFTPAVKAELTPDEVAELEEEHGMQPWDSGEFLRVPPLLVCGLCSNHSEVDAGEN